MVLDHAGSILELGFVANDTPQVHFVQRVGRFAVSERFALLEAALELWLAVTRRKLVGCAGVVPQKGLGVQLGHLDT